MSETVQIPKGWKEITLEDCISNILGGDWGEKDIESPPEDYVRVKILRATEMSNWLEQKGKTGVIRIIKKSSLEKRQLAPNDLILEISGGSTNFTVGRSVLIDEEVLEGDLPVICSNFFRKIRLKDDVNPNFIHYLLHNFHATQRMVQYISKSTNIQNLKVPQLLSHRFVIPPLSIQKKIVQKLDDILGQLEEKKKEIIELMNSQKFEQLKSRNIEQLFFHAFQGNFTKQLQQNNDESISKLLDEIKIKKDMALSKKGKVGVIEKVNFSIPTSWAWVTVNDLTEYVTDGEHITPKRSESGVLLLSARNVQNGSISLEKVDFIPESEYQRISKRLKIEIGDVLLSCSGTVGRCCVLQENLRFSLVRSVAVLKPFFEMGKFLSYAIRSPQVQTQINHKKKNTAQANIFQNQIRSLLIPVPPLFEQKKIVSILDKRISEFSLIDKRINGLIIRKKNTMAYINHLQSSILDAAFSGKLVQ